MIGDRQQPLAVGNRQRDNLPGRSVLVLVLVIMSGPMMIDMSISSTGIMLIRMMAPMIGGAADDRDDH